MIRNDDYSNSNNTINNKKTGKAFSSPFVPKLIVYQEADSEGSEICCFCKNCPDCLYLYTRKQIYVCEHCNEVVDAIMETNHK